MDTRTCLPMRRIYSLLLRILLWMLPLLLPTAAFADDGAIQVIEGTLIELGVVEPEVYRGKLHVVNHRPYPMKVDVRSGDGGFWGIIESGQIPPGDTAIIIVTWDFRTRTGLHWKPLTISYWPDSGSRYDYSNSISVLFVAYVHHDIRVSESMFVLVGMAPDTIVRDTLELRSECDTTVTILAPAPISTGQADITFKFPGGNRIEPGKRLGIVAEGRLKRHPGSFPLSHEIHLETAPSINVSLYLRLIWFPGPSDSGEK